MTGDTGFVEMPLVIGEKRGTAGLVKLNRAKALNSLNLDMVRQMTALLAAYAEDESIVSVIVLGEGERAFCAGGDIRAMHDSGKVGGEEATAFWREEFHMDHFIAHYPKPYVALMDGIVMGGGAGISVHGSHRIVTERTRLAMPETGIGYFPDVGASWFLPRMPGFTGFWMGLTGHEIGAADALYGGLADHCLPSVTLSLVVEAMAALPHGSGAAEVTSVIERFAMPPAGGQFVLHRELIDRVFSAATVEDILTALAAEDDDFAQETLAVLLKRSPKSLKLTLRLLQSGKASDSLAECLEREFAAGLGMLGNADFYEGVRAAVIDKDRNPKWSPATVDAVTDADLQAFFPKGHPPVFPERRM